MKKNHRIAILTGGGDCPGINAVIRAVAKKAILECGSEIIGIEDGYEGIIHNRHRKLEYGDVSGIITLGGTILGTSNIANPFRYAMRNGDKLYFEDISQTAITNLERLEVDCLVCIGGDGTLTIAHRLFGAGVPVIGVPKTIDNDVRGTEITFGFDSAVGIATEGIDRIHTTAQSHHRVMIVEVMGRNAGWLALHAGVAGGGDIILIPEIPYDINIVVEKIKERSRIGKRFSIVVIAEGARPKGGTPEIRRVVPESPEPIRLGGIGNHLCSQIEQAAGIEARTVVMGHLQRGGVPTPFDRVLATRLGTRAIDMIENEAYGFMPGVKGDSLIDVSLEEAARGPRQIQVDDLLVQSARSVGTCFGI